MRKYFGKPLIVPEEYDPIASIIEKRLIKYRHKCRMRRLLKTWRSRAAVLRVPIIASGTNCSRSAKADGIADCHSELTIAIGLPPGR